jgi:hypothetical protein
MLVSLMLAEIHLVVIMPAVSGEKVRKTKAAAGWA